MLKKIKNAIKISTGIDRTLFWLLLARWQSRITPLRFLYKNKRIKAINNYIKSDLEYIKIKNEINKFKIKNIYDFKGIKLPLCVMTPDFFLNVLKPHVENIKYEPYEIAEFYQKQKDKYQTLVYCKDKSNYIKGEPDYVGGHIVSHGFTYFFKEIVINKGDIVFDLGASPGDFSAMCTYLGASKVYAFEPEEDKKTDLKKLCLMSENKIELVEKYSGIKTDKSSNIISLDDFVKDHSDISCVNFIKADIEGCEAGTLLGAVNILRKSKPKLAICTYHLENNEAELEDIIISANKDYKIYKEKGVIYAF